jgi:molybdopterin-biosynthesis enzyme MoeA-like protein
VRYSLERKPNLIITTGGLGPTTDDITLQALAQGLSLPVELNPQALEMVKGRYEELAKKGYIKDGTLTEARRKMAYLPKDATPIFNPVGTAPACLLRRGESLLLSLPGVPEEMKGIWEESLTPLLRDLFGEGFYEERAFLVDCGDESVLAPILQGVARAHPKVYLKSRATKFGPEVKIKVTLSCAGEEKAQVRAATDKALEELRRALQASGLAMEET